MLGCIYAYPCVFALFAVHNQCRYVFTVIALRCGHLFTMLWPATMNWRLFVFVRSGRVKTSMAHRAYCFSTRRALGAVSSPATLSELLRGSSFERSVIARQRSGRERALILLRRVRRALAVAPRGDCEASCVVWIALRIMLWRASI